MTTNNHDEVVGALKTSFSLLRDVESRIYGAFKKLEMLYVTPHYHKYVHDEKLFQVLLDEARLYKRLVSQYIDEVDGQPRHGLFLTGRCAPSVTLLVSLVLELEEACEYAAIEFDASSQSALAVRLGPGGKLRALPALRVEVPKFKPDPVYQLTELASGFFWARTLPSAHVLHNCLFPAPEYRKFFASNPPSVYNDQYTVHNTGYVPYRPHFAYDQQTRKFTRASLPAKPPYVGRADSYYSGTSTRDSVATDGSASLPATPPYIGVTESYYSGTSTRDSAQSDGSTSLPARSPPYIGVTESYDSGTSTSDSAATDGSASLPACPPYIGIMESRYNGTCTRDPAQPDGSASSTANSRHSDTSGSDSAQSDEGVKLDIQYTQPDGGVKLETQCTQPDDSTGNAGPIYLDAVDPILVSMPGGRSLDGITRRISRYTKRMGLY